MKAYPDGLNCQKGLIKLASSAVEKARVLHEQSHLGEATESKFKNTCVDILKTVHGNINHANEAVQLWNSVPTDFVFFFSDQFQRSFGQVTKKTEVLCNSLRRNGNRSECIARRRKYVLSFCVIGFC